MIGNPDKQLFRRGKRNEIEFLPDSAEQIARSINMTGLRTEIDQAFAAAIARAGGASTKVVWASCQ